MTARAPDAEQATPFPIVAVVDACVFPRTRRWLIPITDLAHEGYVQLIWSPCIIAEANRVLTWLWVKRHNGQTTEAAWRECSAAAKQMFAELTRVFRVIDDCPPPATLWTDYPPDEWDAPLWTAAVRARASFIVTENLRDGPPAGVDGIQEHSGVFVVHPDVLLAFVDEMVDRHLQQSMTLPASQAAETLTPFAAAIDRERLADVIRSTSHRR